MQIPPTRKLLIPDPTRPNHYILQIDNSSRETYSLCPRKSFYYLITSRQSPPSPALAYGGIIHRALDHRYRSPACPDQSLIKTQIEIILEGFSQVSFPYDEWRDSSQAIETIKRYNEKYPTELFTVLQVEVPFSIPLFEAEINAELPFSAGQIVADEPASWPVPKDKNIYVEKIYVFWTGRVDLIVSQPNGLWVVDHKTTSMLGPTFWKQFDLSGQTMGYVWAAQQSLNEKVSGVLINAIAARKPTRTGRSIEFERKYFHYRQDQIASWKESTCQQLANFISDLRSGQFYMNYYSCVTKYGACPYFDICRAPKETRLGLLSSNQFEDVTWSPLL